MHETSSQSDENKPVMQYDAVVTADNPVNITSEANASSSVEGIVKKESASVENLKQFSLYVGEYRNMYWFAIGTPLLGELSSGCETERLDKSKPTIRRNCHV